MPFDAVVLRVLIASPSDTGPERGAVEGALHGWNGDRAERERRILLPRRWEMHAVPILGGRGQALINEQLVDPADIVVAVFDSRLGTATAEAVSGTAEEIGRAAGSGKPVHVWFSEEDISRDADLAQLAALRKFERELSEQGLLGRYSSPEDLAFKVRGAIERDLDFFDGPAAPSASGSTGGNLTARYVYDDEPHSDSRGRIRTRRTHRRIVVTNEGRETAEGVTLTLESLTDEAPPILHHDGARPDLGPGDQFSWPIVMASGLARSVSVIFEWHEGAELRSSRRSLSLS